MFTNIKNESRDISTDPKEIKRIKYTMNISMLINFATD